MYEENYNNKEKGGVFFFTLPVGWNSNLDKLLSENKLNFDEAYYFKRISWNNKWRASCKEEALKTKFAKPHIGANGLILGVINKNLKLEFNKNEKNDSAY